MKFFRTSQSTLCTSLSTSQSLSFIAQCWGSRGISIATVVGDLLHSTVDKFTRHAFLQEDKFITESRRVIEPLRSSPESLAERLFRQRHIRQLLIPTSITIDKSRQYIDFTWPAAGVQALDNANRHSTLEQSESQNIKCKKEKKEPSSASEIERTVTKGEENVNEVENENTQEQTREKQNHSQELDNSSSSSSSTSCVKTFCEMNDNIKKKEELIPLPLHTRALAEYLRAYTTSSDGTLATQRLIYGRRGITIKDVIPVGNYALRIAFSDGHDGGIYTYEYLYTLTLHDGSKYHYMRKYIQSLRTARKSRDPPRRARSLRRLTTQEISFDER